MGPYNKLRGLWRPPAEALEAISSVLSEHWRAAAKMRPARLFWPSPARWLRAEPLPAPVPVPVTTSPPAAGSSGTPRDPHRY